MAVFVIQLSGRAVFQIMKPCALGNILDYTSTKSEKKKFDSAQPEPFIGPVSKFII